MFSCTGSAIQKTISGPQTKWLKRSCSALSLSACISFCNYMIIPTLLLHTVAGDITSLDSIPLYKFWRAFKFGLAQSTRAWAY